MNDMTDAEIMHRRYNSSTEELLALWDWLEREHPNRNRNTEREYCFRAGLAAGRARAIEECAATCVEQPIPENFMDSLTLRAVYWQALVDCNATINALNAASPPS